MDSYNTYQCQDSVLFEIALVTSNISNAIDSSWFLKASLRLGKIKDALPTADALFYKC